MHEANLPILRCAQCNKPFDRQSTLKRHGYYCRSRKAGARAIRSRSCIACAKAKARCDHRRPECSRCIAKGVDCQYPAVIPDSKDAKSRAPQDDGPLRETIPVFNQFLETSPINDGDLVLDLDNTLTTTDTEIGNLEALDLLNSDMDFADFLMGSQIINDKVIPVTSTMESSSSDLQRSTHSDNQLSLSIPLSLPIWSSRSLIHRPKFKAGTQRIANLMFHTLKSYPQMMLRPDSLPPFIHPASMLEGFSDNDHMEPLNNCISLVHMVNSRVRGSRKLFWMNVRMECERICEEYLRMNKWEILAAMQALAIYTIMRLDEGETEYNNFDSLIVKTVIVIATQHIRNDHTETALRNSDRESKWQKWIFAESSRRLCIIYRVINMLIYFEPAGMCETHETGLVLAPLPAKKQLWEASDEIAWKMESDRDSKHGSLIDTTETFSASTVFGLAANGELVRLDLEQGQYYCHNDGVLLSKAQSFFNNASSSGSKTTANWEDWCAGMDGLGGLVMLAASLLE
ncbi:hypothetical protein EYB25_006455 [Talaromyces marneffei]|uniref:uncharacterized protein n=1 Tax=Talaromyces marneffei TaxID=37727 RepID=UPI0012A7F1A8|nr:uncharacterized protein EYB26_007593 [Talaromyces marneffei]KAE8550234.1 hypothetical protein EYB25_006455 [Talaromyces marneffei]QGA19898.1 hypothetical protein EYB26_007593 [Talaromyces marneffei]